MQDAIFREYDIRGLVGDEFVIDEVYDLTRAIAYYFVQTNPAVKTIAVGMDGRTHSLAIKERVCQALIDSGLNVVFVGLCPSPALYFALHTLSVDGGLMITASHNTKEYNGIKICLGTAVVWGEKIREIRVLYKMKKHIISRIKGTLTEKFIIATYTEWLVDHFQHLIGMDLAVLIDCGNGTAGTVLPQLITMMKWPHVQLLYAEVDGTYPNHEADPVVVKNMREVIERVRTTDIALGIGIDGDCDRMAPVTKTGKLVPGDQLLAIFAQPIIEANPGAAVVCDIKSSSGLYELLQKWGAHYYISPSGHAIIKDQMKKHNAVLGGELSCHFFFNDLYFGYDDALYAILRLFELIKRSGKTLDELLAVFPKKYSSQEFRVPCADEDKHQIVTAVKDFFVARSDVDILTIDGVRVILPYGWGIVRASNTQPALSMRFEADTQDDLQHVIDDFIQVLQPFFKTENLYKLLNSKGLE